MTRSQRVVVEALQHGLAALVQGTNGTTRSRIFNEPLVLELPPVVRLP